MSTCLALLTLVLLASPLHGDAGDLLLEGSFDGIAPEGIAHDPTDNTFWVTSPLDEVVKHFDAEFTLLGSFPSPFGLGEPLTGIAYYPPNDSLLVVQPISFQLLEIDKTGNPVPGGIDMVLPIQPVPNPVGGPFLRDLKYYANGASGAGSFWVLESIGTLIYEIDTANTILQTIVHPDDPDGYPGAGSSAPSGALELILDAQGDLTAIEVFGETAGEKVIHRLDLLGQLTGFDIPLVNVGLGATGDVGGMARAVFVDPVTSEVFNGIYGTNGSAGSMFVIDGDLPPIAEFTEIECTALDDTITVTWTAGQVYDEIQVLRNGDAFMTLAGDATGLTDPLLADGVYLYEVIGVLGTLTTNPVSCSGVVGAGQVLAFAELTGFGIAIDITEDGDELLRITDGGENLVYTYDKDLFFFDVFTGPFPLDDDFLSGIAYRPETNTLILYNADTNMMQEVDLVGTPIGAPVLAQIPVPVDDDPFVGGLAYDPAGNGGDGLLYAVELTRGIVYQLARDGTVLGSFEHPEEVNLPTPDPSIVNHLSLGVSGVPEVGNGYEQLDLASGSVFDQKCTRILRVDSTTGAPVGFQMPTDAMEELNSVRFLSHINSDYNGDPVAFVVSVRSQDSAIYRVKRDEPAVPSISFLNCAQTDFPDVVDIDFLNHGPYDFIEVERDGVLIATLPGDAIGYTDLDPDPGVHRYRLTPSLGGVTAVPRECEVRVGIGAVLRRSFSTPAFSPYQMTRDKSDGTFIISVNTPALSEELFQYDADLQFIGTIPSPVEPPFQVAALAVRPTPSGREIWSIAWEVRAPFMQPQEFFLSIQDENGGFIQLPTLIDIPGPPVGVALTYPSAMVHDPDTDTFWFLERNSDVFLQMDLAGDIIASLPHPLPPFQNFVFNLGLDLDADRQSFTATTAGPQDQRITKAIGMTREGILTGEEIPLDAANINPLFGIARADGRLWVSGSAGSISQLIELKAADPTEPPLNVDCVETAPSEVLITWDEPVAYDDVIIRRGGVPIATLPGGVLQFTDAGVGTGFKAYTVSGTDGSFESAPSVCSLFVAGGAPEFIRGDVDGDGVFNGLADAVYLLLFQFSGGPPPPCLDAADADDSGDVNGLVDGLWILTFQFLGGPAPLPPFPDAGPDPTPDALGCL